MRHFRVLLAVFTTVAGQGWIGCVRGNEATTTEATRIPIVSPDEAGFDTEHLDRIDGLVAKALSEGKMPGCVVGIGRRGRFVYRKAFGHRSLQPRREPMTVDTVFDMASLTKPIATATSIMILVDRGEVRLRDRVAEYIPEFEQNGKERVTIHDLLTHQSGLLPDNALADYEHGPDEAWRRIWALDLRAEPRTQFIYTDVGFLTLGEVIRRVSGLDVHAFSSTCIFQPLGMTETGYLPRSHLRPRTVVTEQREGRWMQGEVHDPRAYLLGGVAGHAGLFSTVDDLAVYASMMLGRGAWQGCHVMSDSANRAMTGHHSIPGGHIRGLGWDKASSYSSNRGEWMSDAAFGHGGFTGTAMWIDPQLDLFVIFLSNRVHPDGNGSVNDLAGRIGTVAAAALRGSRNWQGGEASGESEVGDRKVLCGIDVLQRERFETLRHRHVGLITNHTGTNREGSSTCQLLHEASEVDLRALFSPEHGIAGVLDQSNIDDSRDEATGLPIHSLYGATRRPTAASLAGIDTLVFDIQDIGCRFYTYISTMGNAMEVAARSSLRFVVLDRPNPINGVDVDGPVLDTGMESFVGYHSLPVRHGMTVGEIATMLADERGWNELDLQVVRIEGWRREMLWDECGLVWVNPSPNMRNLHQALLYPGVGLLETTNISVGRGTDTPFELVGAPWIDGRELGEDLNRARVAGVSFVPTRFRPETSKFAGDWCEGVQILVRRRNAIRPLDVGWTIATTLRRLYPDEWQTDRYMRLLADADVFGLVMQAAPIEAIRRAYGDELTKFVLRRDKYLLYR